MEISRLNQSFKQSNLFLSLLTALLFLLPPALHAKKQSNDFPETGTVRSAIKDHGYIYDVVTDKFIYKLNCDKVKRLQFRDLACTVKGKPIATGDTVNFRIENDQVYLPPSSGSKQQELQILSIELKTAPLPPPASSDGTIRGLVVGIMVSVSPGHPLTVPGAGGAPARAIARPSSTDNSLNMITATNTYDLQCPGDPCQLQDRDIAPGDIFYIRVDKKNALLSTDGVNFPPKEKFGVNDVDTYTPPSTPTSNSPRVASTP